MDKSNLPDVFFGPADKKTLAPLEDDVDDDALLKKTPLDVVELLGFDPRELFDEE